MLCGLEFCTSQCFQLKKFIEKVLRYFKFYEIGLGSESNISESKSNFLLGNWVQLFSIQVQLFQNPSPTFTESESNFFIIRVQLFQNPSLTFYESESNFFRIWVQLFQNPSPTLDSESESNFVNSESNFFNSESNLFNSESNLEEGESESNVGLGFAYFSMMITKNSISQTPESVL